MQNSIAIPAIILSLLIAGCAGEKKLNDLKNPRNAVQGSYIVEQDYVETYQRIIQSGKLPTVEGKFALYPNQKKGQVWVEAYGGYFLVLLDISPSSSGDTQSLVEYSCIDSWVSWCKSIEKMFQ